MILHEMKKLVNQYLLIASVAIVYFVAARLGLMLACPGTNATPLWLPTGIALSTVLLLGDRMWPGIALGAFIANFQQLAGLGLSIPASFAASLSTSSGNTLEALIGAYLIHRFTGTRNPFERSADVLAFILFGALISTTVSATIGTATFCLSVSAWKNFASIWLTWWLGDAAGAIVLVPLVMTVNGFDAARWKFRPLAGNLLLWAFIGVVCYSIFSRSIPLNFLLFPVLIIAAFRLGQFGSAMAVGIISVVSTYVTVNGTGPFSAGTLTEALLLQQGFIGSIATASMVLAAIVSEQKKSERKLSESEGRSRMLIEQAPVGIAFSRDGITLDANKVYLGMFGYADFEELRGRPLIDQIAPQSRPEVLDRIRQRAAGQTVGTVYETMGMRKDGSQFPFYVSVNRIVFADGPLTISFFIDITERKRVEEALQDNERKYRELVMNANSIILRWNSEGRITFMNEYGLKFFGYSEAEILGRHVIGTIVPEKETSGRDLRPLMDQITANPAGFEQNVNENMLKNGEHVWINWTNKVVVDERGQVKEILSIGSDITERKHAEEELKNHRELLEEQVLKRTADLQKIQLALTNIVEDLNFKKEELEAANQKLKEVDHLKSLFIASMSHELRTPLNSIIGFTGILLQGLAGELNTEQRKQLGMVKSSSEHLLSLITDVIDLSKIEAGKIDLSMETFDLSEVVREVLGSFQVMADRKALSLSAEMPPGLILVSDKRRIRQVLVNLVGNSMKFTEHGGVSVSALSDGDLIKVSVADTGMGIRQEDQDKLFKSFSQVTTAEAPKHEGTGLGLYLSKRLVTLLGGEIGVQSKFGKGSAFFFTVPMKQ